MNKQNRKSERGSAGAKLVAVMVVLFLIGHAGYNYIPVAYQGQSFQQEMQTAILQGVALPGLNKTPADVVKEKIVNAIRLNGIPSNAVVEVKALNNSVQARVAYAKVVNLLPFGIYTYNYQFDHTATPTGFLLKQ